MNNRLIMILSAIAAVFFFALLTLSSRAEGIVFDLEDGVWTEADDQEENKQSGYMTLLRGHVIYRDANRTDPIGYPTEESVVYATCVRTYEKGAVYQVRFDTQKSWDEEKCVTGYYYTQYPRMEERPEPSSEARLLDGIVIPIIRFHYGAETGAESQYNVVTASGTAFIAKGGTNLREGPGASYNYVARLAKDTRVTITGFNINSNVTWYYVYDGEGNRGFVRADLLTDLPSTMILTPEQTGNAADTVELKETVSPDAVENGGDATELKDAGNPETSINEEGAQGPETPEERTESEKLAEEAPLAEDEKKDEKPEGMEESKDDKDLENEEEIESEETPEDREGSENETESENSDLPTYEGENETEVSPEDNENRENMESSEKESEHEATDKEEIREEESVQREVHVMLRWENTGESPVFGDRAVLTAKLSGYENTAYTLQWQTSEDGQNWSDVPSATMPSLVLTMTEDNYQDFWRVLVKVETPK